MTSDLWWKTAFVYCLDVQTFHDGNGDGMGDFRGLSAKVDHLAELGVTVLWLMPFYPTADRDDGYDISDFCAVDPRLGTLGDMVEFLRIARDRGIRVIADLVINHTSAEHPWFTDARSSRTSRYRDWYLWRDDEPTGPTQPVVFPGEQQRVWTHTPETDAWYHHDFYRHQPTLNVANPEVRDEITRIMGFWMELGLAGFRVDAVPFLLQTVDEADRPVDAAVDEPHELLQTLRGFLVRRRGDAILLGEVNLPHDKAATFFGSASGDQLSMLFDFTTMQSLYLAMARRDATVLRRTLHDRPIEPSTCQWAMFLRNHDELTLDQLDEEQRAEVFAAFGPREDMQLFGRGLRRRLPPMLGGDGDRLRMAYSLLFSLPGTPSVFYGEEIGMGENLDIDGRMAVRTPMQWDDGPNAGFSTVDDPSRLVRPLVQGEYDPQNGVTVADQRDDPASLLSWVTLLARRYRDCPELAWGTVDVLDVEPAAVLALRARWEGGTVLVVHNLSAADVDVDLGLDGESGTRTISDLLGTDGRYDLTDTVLSLHLSRYDTRWYRIVGR